MAEVKHGQASIRRPKSEAELDEQLATKQRSWDTTRKRYNAVRSAVDSDTLQDLDQKWQDYEAYSLRSHAEAESLPVFGLISKDDEVRKAARQALGVE